MRVVCMQVDTTGVGLVVIDALAKREWVKEDELADSLKMHPKLLRRVLRYLESVSPPTRAHAALSPAETPACSSVPCSACMLQCTRSSFVSIHICSLYPIAAATLGTAGDFVVCDQDHIIMGISVLPHASVGA